MGLNLSNIEVIAVVAMGVAAIAWAVVRIIRSRRKTPEEIEKARRLDIHRRGRISSGQIVDLIEPEGCEKGYKLVVYKYNIAGVDYEVAQDLAQLSAIYEIAKQIPGKTISLKYDPQRPSNSIVACEEWSGISLPAAGGVSGQPSLSPSSDKAKGD